MAIRIDASGMSGEPVPNPFEQDRMKPASVACWRPAQEPLLPNPISLLRVCELAEGPTVNRTFNRWSISATAY
jgi:hypothetical protein